jgi:hypothetical protein
MFTFCVGSFAVAQETAAQKQDKIVKAAYEKRVSVFSKQIPQEVKPPEYWAAHHNDEAKELSDACQDLTAEKFGNSKFPKVYTVRQNENCVNIKKSYRSEYMQIWNNK